MPTAAVAQMDAAVVSPRTESPLLETKITPLPKKPIPIDIA